MSYSYAKDEYYRLVMNNQPNNSKDADYQSLPQLNVALYETLDGDKNLLICDTEDYSGGGGDFDGTILLSSIFNTFFPNNTNTSNFYLGYATKRTYPLYKKWCMIHSGEENNWDFDETLAIGESSGSDSSAAHDLCQVLENNHIVKSFYNFGTQEEKRYFPLIGHDINTVSIHLDKIRLDILQGYNFNNIEGMTIKMKMKQKGALKKYTNIANIVLRKEQVWQLLKFNKNPHWQAGRYYDRYIEFSVPSAYALWWMSNPESTNVPPQEKNIGKWLNLNPLDDVIIEVTLLDDKNIKDHELQELFPNDFNETIIGDNVILEGTSIFSTSQKMEINVDFNSNSELFNVVLFHDKFQDCITYYPTFGINGDKLQELNSNIFWKIDNGEIPLTRYNYISKIESEEFEKDDDERKSVEEDWLGKSESNYIIMNEIYERITYRPDPEKDELVITRNRTEYVDYVNNTEFDQVDANGNTIPGKGKFWRTSFRPLLNKMMINVNQSGGTYIKTCEPQTYSMVVTSHLLNQNTGMDITKSASITVENPMLYFGNNRKSLQIESMQKYTIVNRSIDNTLQYNVLGGEGQNLVIKRFYDASNIVIQDPFSSNVYTSGKLTLKLYHTDHDYLIRVFQLTDNGGRVPYNLAGINRYFLQFPTNGERIKIYNDASQEAVSMGQGSLLFTIKGEDVDKIFTLPKEKRWFALCMEGTKMVGEEETTLYEGNVALYTE